MAHYEFDLASNTEIENIPKGQSWTFIHTGQEKAQCWTHILRPINNNLLHLQVFERMGFHPGLGKEEEAKPNFFLWCKCVASRNSNKSHHYDSKVKIHNSEISVEAKPGESGCFLGRQFHFPGVVQLAPTDTVRDIEILQKTKQASQIQDSSNYIIWNEFTFFFFLHFPTPPSTQPSKDARRFKNFFQEGRFFQSPSSLACNLKDNSLFRAPTAYFLHFPGGCWFHPG